MKTTHIFIATLFFASTLLFTSCSKDEGCTDPLANNYNADAEKDNGSCTYAAAHEDDHTHITFNFTHNFAGLAVDNSTFNQFSYYNMNGDTLSISKLRYLISDVRLYKANGDSIVIDGYSLVDVTAGTGMTYVTTADIPHDTYSGISFIFGFDEDDNTDQAYPDLNVVNWNWPGGLMGMPDLGGGYHFMQMEGKYKHLGNDSTYAYHHGTAKVSMGVFEQNYFKADLAGVTLNKENATVEIKMDIAEWYKTPNTWDLNQYHRMLMPNYTAQKMMQANGASVFSLGTVTQNN